MKATRKFGMWKAIAFLTVVICLFSCTSCEDEILVKAVVTVAPAESITENSATVMAMVTPNQDNTDVLIRYKADNSDWKVLSHIEKLSGTNSQVIFFSLFDLQPSTSYNFEVIASNAAGPSTVKGVAFTTLGLKKAVAKMKAVENITKTTAKLNAVIIPNQNGTEVFAEYQTEKSAWASESLGSSFSGKDSVKVTLDLSDLQLGTKYNVRVKVVNKAGEVLSDTISFETYAVSDFDGNLYHTVTIGKQTWLKENFKGTHFANGDPIANVTTFTEWNNNTVPAYCWYNNDSKIGQEYGGLYNKAVAFDSRGLIIGYHVPTAESFEYLNDYLGGWSFAGLHILEAGNTHWKNTVRAADNSSGFTALPNGYLDPETLTFSNLGQEGNLWTSTLAGPGFCVMEIKNNCTFTATSVFHQNFGLGIRLLKN